MTIKINLRRCGFKLRFGSEFMGSVKWVLNEFGLPGLMKITHPNKGELVKWLILKPRKKYQGKLRP